MTRIQRIEAAQARLREVLAEDKEAPFGVEKSRRATARRRLRRTFGMVKGPRPIPQRKREPRVTRRQRMLLRLPGPDYVLAHHTHKRTGQVMYIPEKKRKGLFG